MSKIICISDKLLQQHPIASEKLLHIFNKYNISYEIVQNTQDIWVRDFMPFCLDSGQLISYNYLPDYLNNEQDSCLITILEKQTLHLDLVLDGGNFVRYKNKVIMTDKIFSENSHLSKDTIIELLKEKCNLSQVIIIPKQPYDIYGHSDSMVRWIDETTVLVNDFLNESKTFNDKLIYSLKSQNLKIKTLKYSQDFFTKERNWGAYLNFLIVDRILILPIYGILEDALVINQIKNLYEDYEIVPIELHEIISKGGALHCITSNKLTVDKFSILDMSKNDKRVLSFRIKKKQEVEITNFQSFKKLMDIQKDIEQTYSVVVFSYELNKYQLENLKSDIEQQKISISLYLNELIAIKYGLAEGTIHGEIITLKPFGNGWLDLSLQENIVFNGLIQYISKYQKELL